MQNLVLSKYNNSDRPTKIFRDLNGVISLATIERWCKITQTDGSINLRKSPGCARTIRTKAVIQKVKVSVNRLKESVLPGNSLVNWVFLELAFKEYSVDDLGLRAYKVQIEPLLTDEHKEKRIRFANWIRTNFRKEDTMKILFSDEKMFDIDGVYNSQNERIWAVDRAEADTRGGIRQNVNFRKRLWFGSQFVRKESLLSSFSRKAQSITTGTSKKCCQLL